nr:MAG TPA: nucleoid-associated protein [Caudoviricetes sp.]
MGIKLFGEFDPRTVDQVVSNAKYIKGGYITVKTEAERNAIAAGVKVAGMPVYVSDQKKTYRWNGTAWEEEIIVGTPGPQGPAGEPGADGKDGTDGAEGLSIYRTSATVTTATTTITGSLITIPEGRTVKPDDFLLANNGYLFRVISYNGSIANVHYEMSLRGLQGPQGEPGKDGTNGTNGADGAQGADGAEGLSIYLTTKENSGSATQVIDEVDIVVPTGRTLKIGDFIVSDSTSSFLYRIRGFVASGGGVYVDYINTLKGNDGKSVYKAEIDENRHLILTLTGGTTVDAGEIPDYKELPDATASDNGKVLGVVGGGYQLVTPSGGGGSSRTLIWSTEENVIETDYLGINPSGKTIEIEYLISDAGANTTRKLARFVPIIPPGTTILGKPYDSGYIYVEYNTWDESSGVCDRYMRTIRLRFVSNGDVSNPQYKLRASRVYSHYIEFTMNSDIGKPSADAEELTRYTDSAGFRLYKVYVVDEPAAEITNQ